MAPVVMMHNGGWDEMALVAGPVAIIVLLIVLARRQGPVADEDEQTPRT
ncbi:hypothetical protein [Actinokineospora iranica]|uniref:Uncharacterized protein n=1 Tax=Actinokineospora iranica TaxID=1271860 RepID=A0A1G6WJE6_9PSEU|nr:hypothetical protein [Actinokineospora iranica]SDD65377.1 hypothetical protein SAMN05216174_11512 [Actinokineospora iranica]